MRRRTGAVRLMAFVVAATLSWSLVATCVEGAMLTPSAQMACCMNGHHTCGHLGTPADCCKTASHANQFTAAGKISPAPPPQAVAEAFGSVLTTLPALWHRRPLMDTWSPHGTKHPTYLRLSVLRL